MQMTEFLPDKVCLPSNQRQGSLPMSKSRVVRDLVTVTTQSIFLSLSRWKEIFLPLISNLVDGYKVMDGSGSG